MLRAAVLREGPTAAARQLQAAIKIINPTHPFPYVAVVYPGVGLVTQEVWVDWFFMCLYLLYLLLPYNFVYGWSIKLFLFI